MAWQGSKQRLPPVRPKGCWQTSHHPVIQQALLNHLFNKLGLPQLYVPAGAQSDRTATVRTRMPGGVGGAAL